MHAAPAWWDLASADHRKRLERFMRRAVWLNLYKDKEPTITQLVDSQSILDDDDHVIH